MKPNRLMWAVIVCLFAGIELWGQQPNTLSEGLGSNPSNTLNVPRLIKFSGVMKDFTGKPLMGPVDINFAIYKEQTDAEPVWQEMQTLQLDEQGRYTVLLGAMQPEGLPMELFSSGEARWLEVNAAGTELQPRTLLVSVPYALKAGDAATLGGIPASAYLLATQGQSGSGTTQGTKGSGTGTAGSGATGQAALLTTPTVIRANVISATQNYIPVLTDNSGDMANSVMYQSGTNLGIDTTTPGTLNGTYFPSVLLQASQAGASTYLTADTELAGGYAGLLLNRGAANANNRLWAIENQPAAGNTSSQFAISTYTDAGTPTALLTLSRAGNLGIAMTTPGTLNGTSFPSVLLQAAQAGASTYLTADTGLAGGYAGLLLNRGAATANYRLWAIENQPSASNTSSQFAISTYSDAGLPTALLTILRSGQVGIGITAPSATLDVKGTGKFSGSVAVGALTVGNCVQAGPAGLLTTTGSPCGSASITGVTAGTDLTGGGTSGTVTLNLDTTKVPTLAASSNTFAGSITAASVSATSSSGTPMSGNYTGANASTAGMYGTSPSGVGVFGVGAIGVEGNGSTNIGVYGTGATGVYGISNGHNYGVWGAQGSGSYAGWFGGPVYVSGLLTKAGGGFKIDHPLDPANKYLVHSFVESPDMKNVYDGVAVLDANGEAWVDLPEYFATLNSDFRYQLTAIRAPAPGLYIAEEISGNRFKIAGGKPGGKVSWQVTGIRQDAFAKAHRIQVEEAKPQAERGFYLHPELYGQPKEKGIDWARHPQQMRQPESASKLPGPAGGGVR